MSFVVLNRTQTVLESIHSTLFRSHLLVTRQLLDSKAPVLLIMRQLHLQGWASGERPRCHTRDSPKLYGESGHVARKPYLQCLLMLDVLFDAGLQWLSSAQPAAYYNALLNSRTPASVPLVREALCDDEADLALEDDNSNLHPRPAQDSDEESDLPTGTAAGDQTRSGQALLASEDPSGSLVRGASRAAASSEAGPCQATTSSSSSSDSEPAGALCAAVIPPPLLPNITIEERLEAGQRGHYRRLICQCPLRRGEHSGALACTKKRGLGQRQLAGLGPRGTEAFLGVWAAAAGEFTSQQAHARWNPSVAQVRAFMVERGWAAS